MSSSAETMRSVIGNLSGENEIRHQREYEDEIMKISSSGILDAMRKIVGMVNDEADDSGIREWLKGRLEDAEVNTGDFSVDGIFILRGDQRLFGFRVLTKSSYEEGHSEEVNRWLNPEHRVHPYIGWLKYSSNQRKAGRTKFSKKYSIESPEKLMQVIISDEVTGTGRIAVRYYPLIEKDMIEEAVFSSIIEPVRSEEYELNDF